MNQKARKSGDVGKDILEGRIRKNLDLSIKVDVNSMTDTEEEETHGSAATIVCQLVVVKDTVVDTFAGGTVLVDFLVLNRVSGNRRIKVDVNCRLDIEAVPGFGRGAGPDARTG